MLRADLGESGVCRHAEFVEANTQGEEPSVGPAGPTDPGESAPWPAFSQSAQELPFLRADALHGTALTAGTTLPTGRTGRSAADRTAFQVTTTLGGPTTLAGLGVRGAQGSAALAAGRLVDGAQDPAVEEAGVRALRAHLRRAHHTRLDQAVPHRPTAGRTGPGAADAQGGLSDCADAATTGFAERTLALAADLPMGDTRAVLPATTDRNRAARAQQSIASPALQVEAQGALPAHAGPADLAVGAAVGAMLGTVIPTVCREVAEGAEGKGLP